MAPKRKAGAPGSDRPSKRAASGVQTPVSIEDSGSDDEYDEAEEFDEEIEDVEDVKADRKVQKELSEQYADTVQKFQPQAYQNVAASTHRDAASRLFKPGRDYVDQVLKPDHHLRPMWIDSSNARLVIETFAANFKAAQNFVINIAEPQSRTANMHEYTITPHSLFAAVSVGLTEQDILGQLDLYSKVAVPESIKAFVHEVTESFGKVRLVLKHNQYFIECNDQAALYRLLDDDVIRDCRADDKVHRGKAATAGDASILPTIDNARIAQQAAQEQSRIKPADGDESEEDEYGGREAEKDMEAFLREEEDDDETVDEVHSFEINKNKIQTVQQRCNVVIKMPLTEEYDFRADTHNANLDIDLRPNVQIRYYQEHALSKMFGNGRARSGIIVLPCGAGKTLVGITAACTVKKSAIVLCTSAMSAVQWKEEFKKWSNIDPQDIAVFTSGEKQKLGKKAGVIICTYSMISQEGRRAHDSQAVMDSIMQREWGVMILDEVHVVPAAMFRKVTERIQSHSKLGLTATLLREDDKIDDLNFLIGPKLYEANWLQLSEEGHIARVQCAEVWCPMTAEFYSEYLNTTSNNRRNLLSTMNPNKYQAAQYLIDYHERRGDKIIVFSDNVYALKRYAKGLEKYCIYGDTPQHEREKILQNFQLNDQVRTIILSKIGDTSLDLPEATCLIQVSSHYGSRRQEAQRLGRILRAKRRNDEGFNAFFYSLVSKDTNEVFYSAKRQAFLVDQGYAFKVITNLAGKERMPGLQLNTQEERMDLLQDVLLQSESAGAIEKIEGNDDVYDRPGARKSGVRRQAGKLSGLSGADSMGYMSGKTGSKKMQEAKRSGFFKKLDARNARQRKAREMDG